MILGRALFFPMSTEKLEIRINGDLIFLYNDKGQMLMVVSMFDVGCKMSMFFVGI